jgi:hypothetical protein
MYPEGNESNVMVHEVDKMQRRVCCAEVLNSPQVCLCLPSLKILLGAKKDCMDSLLEEGSISKPAPPLPGDGAEPMSSCEVYSDSLREKSSAGSTLRPDVVDASTLKQSVQGQALSLRKTLLSCFCGGSASSINMS